LDTSNRPTTPYDRVGFHGNQAFLATETNEENGMKAADGTLAHVSTCEERRDRFGLLRRRAAARAMPASVVQPSSDAPLQLLSRLVTPDSAFLEVAATDCSLSLSLADSVRRVYAVARSAVIIGTRRLPANFHLIAAEGNCIPVPQASIDVAYSNGLVDHLDPEQTCEQFANVQRALTRGGVFVCCARNRLLGAGDVGNGVAPLHTFSELRAMLRRVGFRKVAQYARCAGRNVSLPSPLARLLELVVCTMPQSLRARACSTWLREVLEIRLVARK
jgi:methyltransferase family protein